MLRFVLPFLVLLPLTAAAQIYRWVDANGQVHFSQNPPASGNYQNVTPSSDRTAGPGPNPGYRPSSNAPASNGDAEQKSRQVALKTKADNAERCAKARERISFLEEKTAHRLFKTGPDGEPARLTDEEFDQQMKDARDAASKYCS